MMSWLVRHMVEMPGAQFHGLPLPQLQIEKTIGRPVCAVARAIESLIDVYAVCGLSPSALPPHQSTFTKSNPHFENCRKSWS